MVMQGATLLSVPKLLEALHLAPGTTPLPFSPA